VGLVTRPELPLRVAPVPGADARPDAETLQQIRAAVPHQPRRVALVLAGDADRGGWWGPGRPADWSDAVGAARALGAALAVDLTVAADEHAPWHPGRCARIALADGTLVGHAGELHPKALAALGLPARTCAAELDVDVLSAASDTVVVARGLSTYPVAHSDVALVVPSDVPAGEVEAALREGTGDLLESLSLFDVYTGDQVGDQHKSLAYRMEFRAPDRTLTTEEVNALRDRAIASAAAATGAVQRGA
jgi:phenylalanyl-tRNA synthetase beta chain